MLAQGDRMDDGKPKPKSVKEPGHWQPAI